MATATVVLIVLPIVVMTGLALRPATAQALAQVIHHTTVVTEHVAPKVTLTAAMMGLVPPMGTAAEELAHQKRH